MKMKKCSLKLKKTTVCLWGFDKGSKAFVASNVCLCCSVFLADMAIHSQLIMPKPHVPIPTYCHPFPCTRASLRPRTIWPMCKVPVRRDRRRSAKQIIHRRYEKHIALGIPSKGRLSLSSIRALRQRVYKTGHHDQPSVLEQKISYVQIEHTDGSEEKGLRDGDNLQNSELPCSIPGAGPDPSTRWNTSCSNVVHLGSAVSSESPARI